MFDHFQCDVLDGRYAGLEQVVKTSLDFEAIRSAHTRFLDR